MRCRAVCVSAAAHVVKARFMGSIAHVGVGSRAPIVGRTMLLATHVGANIDGKAPVVGCVLLQRRQALCVAFGHRHDLGRQGDQLSVGRLTPAAALRTDAERNLVARAALVTSAERRAALVTSAERRSAERWAAENAARHLEQPRIVVETARAPPA